MSDAVADRLGRFFEEAAPEGLVSAYLFVSQAEARSHRESDIDVFVLPDRRSFSTRRDRFEERLRLIASTRRALGRNGLDLVIPGDTPSDLGARSSWRP
jgi:predicted nucleotidyltransferase